MKMVSIVRVVVALFIATTVSAIAQDDFRVTVRVNNNGGALDSITLGIAPGATDGIDQAFGEEEFPPFPPTSIFHARFVNGDGHTELGEGVKVDVRGYRNSEQADTFNIKFQAGEGGYPVTITWPEDLAEYAGKMTIKTFAEPVDMLTNTSFTVAINGITFATIIREGSPVSDVESGSGEEPVVAAISCPNPVHRSTGATFSYTTVESGNVSIALYDNLGREVQILVNEDLHASQHAAELDTRNLAVGAYFIVMKTGDAMITAPVVVID